MRFPRLRFATLGMTELRFATLGMTELRFATLGMTELRFATLGMTTLGPPIAAAPTFKFTSVQHSASLLQFAIHDIGHSSRAFHTCGHG